MRSIITCTVLLLAMLAGAYVHVYWMAYDFPTLRWIPGWDQDPIGIAFLHYLYVLPAIGIVSLVITIFHRRLSVSLRLSLPALIYAILCIAYYAYFSSQQRPPKWLHDADRAYGASIWHLVFWITFIMTIWACVNQFRKDRKPTEQSVPGYPPQGVGSPEP